MSRIIHFIAHLLGWNMGSVVTKYDHDGNLWVAFKCAKCGCYQDKSKCMTETKRLKA